MKQLVWRCKHCGCLKDAEHTPGCLLQRMGWPPSWYPTFQTESYEQMAARILNETFDRVMLTGSAWYRALFDGKDFHYEPVKPYFWGHSELKAEGEPRTYPNMGMWDAPTGAPRFHKHAYRPWFAGQEKCISCGHLIIVDQELHDRVNAEIDRQAAKQRRYSAEFAHVLGPRLRRTWDAFDRWELKIVPPAKSRRVPDLLLAITITAVVFIGVAGLCYLLTGGK